jgi:endonuclease III
LAPESPSLGAICRARRIVATLGGRFSLELRIDLGRDPAEVERWALAATLLGNRVPTSVGLRTYRVLEQAGVRAIADVPRRSRRELVSLTDEGGFGRYAELTASRLLALAKAIVDRYPEGLATLGEQALEPDELERALLALPGWGPVTVSAFLRELRGVWPAVAVPLDPRADRAARHVALPSGSRGLASLAAAAHLDLRDLEAALVRLCLGHDLAACPGGEECPFAAFGRDQFVHF